MTEGPNREFWKAFSERSYEAMFYGFKRMDILIISISAGGIALCFETMKFLMTRGDEISYLLKWAAALFVISIIVNLISQMLGAESGKKAYEYSQKMLNDSSNHDQDELAQSRVGMERLSKTVSMLNYTSLLLLMIGILCLMIYYIMA